MTYSSTLQDRLRAGRKAGQQPPVGVLARLVVGRPGLDRADIPHPSRLRSGAITIDADLNQAIPTDPTLSEAERLAQMVPVLTVMAGRAMEALAGGDQRARTRLDAFAHSLHTALGYPNILVLEAGPHRTYYELAGDSQAARAHLQRLIDDLGDRPASGADLADWIARHPSAFGPGRGPAETAVGPMRGLIARMVAGSPIVDRTMVRSCSAWRQWREEYERSFAAALKFDVSAYGETSPGSMRLVWATMYLSTITTAMDAPSPSSEPTRCILHAGGMALLDEMDCTNVLLIQDADDAQIEILGDPQDAYHTISRLIADLRPDSELADVRAWIDAHPELFGARTDIQRPNRAAPHDDPAQDVPPHDAT